MIRLENVNKVYRTERVETLALQNINLDVASGEFVSIMGPSGCGKSTTGRAIARLNRPTAGSIRLDGQELTTLEGAALRIMRRRLQMIFQDPYSSLNPRMTVGAIIAEPLEIHGVGSARARAERVHPLGRLGRPEDIAAAAVWLCSDESSWITGHALVVDGGLTAQSHVTGMADPRPAHLRPTV